MDGGSDISLSGRPETVSERRKRAVAAYCRELFEPQLAAAVGAEALFSFTVSGGASTADDQSGDEQLLSLVRVSAASRLQADGPPDWAAGGARTEAAAQGPDCRQTAMGLARRANGELEPHQETTLESHIRTCLRCRATVLELTRAERAFTVTLGPGPNAPSISPVQELVPYTAEPDMIMEAAEHDMSAETPLNAIEAQQEPPREARAPADDAAPPMPPQRAIWTGEGPAVRSGYTPHPHVLRQRRRRTLVVVLVIVVALVIIAIAALLGGASSPPVS